MYVSNQIVSMYSCNSNFINSRGMERRNTRVKIKTKITELPTSPFGQRIYELTRKIENYRLQIFWLTLYILVTLGIFLERAFCEYNQNCFKSQWKIKEIQTRTSRFYTKAHYHNTEKKLDNILHHAST